MSDQEQVHTLICPQCGRELYVPWQVYGQALQKGAQVHPARPQVALANWPSGCPGCTGPHEGLLSLVLPAAAAEATTGLFARAGLAGVAVAVSRPTALWVYYEAGLRSAAPATLEDRRRYALIAAERAQDTLPTVQRFTVRGWNELRVVGYVDPQRLLVWWEPEAGADARADWAGGDAGDWQAEVIRAEDL